MKGGRRTGSGRKPRPTHLKVVEGKTYRLGKRKAEPIPPGDLLEPPETFTDDQAASWNYAILHAPQGLLKRLDRGMLALWCVAECLHEKARLSLETTPLVVKSPNGTPMQSPWLSILNRQAAIMRGLAADLGFSPTARTRIAAEEAPGEDDPAEKYFND